MAGILNAIASVFTEASGDPDYQAYLKTAKESNFPPLPYEKWQATRERKESQTSTAGVRG